MGILDDLIREIEDLLKEAEETVEANPTPLANPEKAEFESDVSSASTKSSTALGDDFFDGLNGSVLQPPTPSGQLDWWHQMAENVQAVVSELSPTPGQKQQAADELATMSDPARRSELISEYT